MSFGVGINLWNAGVLGGDAGAALGVGTDLQRILALSPSLLVWPANGAGWQGTSGGTLAASGQPLGLGVDLAALGGKTLSEWLASAPDIKGTGVTGIVGTATAATYNTSTGVGSVSRVLYPTDQSYVEFTGLTPNGIYVFEFSATGFTNTVALRTATNDGSPIFNGSPNTLAFARASAGGVILITAGGNNTATFTLLSVKELPGNHLRAGTWASPSDAARGTFQNNAISFDGSSDYYSLLNAISITESMTVVRAFKRASAGINSIGLGNIASANPRDFNWDNVNDITQGLGSSGFVVATGNTTTGSFVSTARRGATTEIARLNGTQVSTRSVASVSGNLDAFGRRLTVYNSGEISFLAVFPTELTGANLALVEQIAAATNSAVLA